MPLEYAAPWKRGAAFLLDLAIVSPVVFAAPDGLAVAAMLALGSAACETSGWQRTPGKAVLRTKTMERHGRQVGSVRAVARSALKSWALFLFVWGWLGPKTGFWEGGNVWKTVLYFLPLALLGISIAADRRRRGWHDRICGTSVISLPGSEVKAEEE
jgi:uncharacterized RDD family membrane protein YckC